MRGVDAPAAILESMTDSIDMEEGPVADAEALLDRIRLIEDQPLEQRADAFAQLHAQLQAALEGADRL